MIKAKKFIYANRCNGIPTQDNIKLIEVTLPPLKDGEYMVEAVYITVEPYHVNYFQHMEIGDTMLGNQVARVIQSKSSKFTPGMYVTGGFGWRTHTIVSEKQSNSLNLRKPRPMIIPRNIDNWRCIPISLMLGVLGIPGIVACYALKLAKVKAGDIIVITNATGAIGYHAGQIAKFVECTVIGIANTHDKCDWLRDIGFDYAINYKSDNLDEALCNVAPSGIDCFFDSDSGEIHSKVINKMKRHGRIILYDRIYAMTDTVRDTELMMDVIQRELKVREITQIPLILSFRSAITVNKEMLLQRQLRFRETKIKGFERMLDLLVKILMQDTIGVGIVEV